MRENKNPYLGTHPDYDDWSKRVKMDLLHGAKCPDPTHDSVVCWQSQPRCRMTDAANKRFNTGDMAKWFAGGNVNGWCPYHATENICRRDSHAACEWSACVATSQWKEAQFGKDKSLRGISKKLSDGWCAFVGEKHKCNEQTFCNWVAKAPIETKLSHYNWPEYDERGDCKKLSNKDSGWSCSGHVPGTKSYQKSDWSDISQMCGGTCRCTSYAP